jgi:hypothetical protein
MRRSSNDQGSEALLVDQHTRSSFGGVVVVVVVAVAGRLVAKKTKIKPTSNRGSMV